MKKSVSLMIQKTMTVIKARQPPNTIPVAKISFSFQLSGNGDGFTRSFEIVMIVPIKQTNRFIKKKFKIIKRVNSTKLEVKSL